MNLSDKNMDVEDHIINTFKVETVAQQVKDMINGNEREQFLEALKPYVIISEENKNKIKRKYNMEKNKVKKLQDEIKRLENTLKKCDNCQWEIEHKLKM